MGRQADTITKQELLDSYINVKTSMSSACKTVGCSPSTFIKALEMNGLKGKSKQWNISRTNKYPKLQDKEWLKAQLRFRTMADIATELGTSNGNVSDFAKRYGLRVPNRSEAIKRGQAIALPNGQRGALAANWKGGRVLRQDYWRVFEPDHPYATKQGYIAEHRLIMESLLGRYLDPKEYVHHVNGCKQDNRPSNLLLCTHTEHTKIHYESVEKAWIAEQRLEQLREDKDREIRYKDRKIRQLQSQLKQHQNGLGVTHGETIEEYCSLCQTIHV